MPGSDGNSYRRLRDAQGLTQEQLSEISGVSLATIQRLEAGTAKNPRIVTLLALTAALQTKLGELLEGRWRADAAAQGRWDLHPRLPADVKRELTDARTRRQRERQS